MNIFQKLAFVAKHFVGSPEYRTIFFNWVVHHLKRAEAPQLTITAPDGSTYILSEWKNWTEYEFWKKHKVPAIDGKIIQAALAKPDSVCLDVGANIGIYSLYFAACGANKVYSFEPAKENFQRLLKNIEKNPRLSRRITPVQKAVSDTHQQLSVYFNAASPGHTKVGTEDSGIESCQAISMEQFCSAESILKVALLKVDVEGFEMHVLLGCKELLIARRIEIIFFESYDNALSHFGSSRLEQWNYLNSCSYHIFTLSGIRLDAQGFCASESPDFVATYYDVFPL